MKAEHRKELQTNSLADLLGRTVRKVRSGGGFSWFKVILILVVVLGVVFFFWRRANIARSEAEAWVMLDKNDIKDIVDLATNHKDSVQGQAAQLTFWYGRLWEIMREYGSTNTNLGTTLRSIDELRMRFEELATACKDDPLRAAEAKYHIAVCNESLAIADAMFLDKAKEGFEELSKGDLGSTSYGLMAKKRLEQYNNPAEFAAISSFYKEFRKQFKMDQPPGK